MKNIIMVMFCLLLSGCHNMTSSDNKLSEAEIKLKYVEMKDKLVEYGKLVFENEQWLNNDSKIKFSSISLKELSEGNGYDISMFVNPRSNKQCDLNKTRVEFIIKDVSNIEDIIYDFNPVLVCDVDGLENKNELNDKFLSYIFDAYDNKYISVNEGETYIITLGDLYDYGYDISMFVNFENNKQCDLDNSYGVFEVFGNNDDGKLEYFFSGILECE